MKKHIIAFLIITLILTLIAVGVFFIVKHNKKQSLYKSNYEFIYSTDTVKLVENIATAESLYQTKVSSGENRLTVLHDIIVKLDSFEKDLNSHLVLSSSNSSTSNKLSKKYQTLTSERAILINNFDEYITRMSGNINISGSATKDLYNEIFNKTTNFIYNYNSCFASTFNFVFNKVYTAETIKPELYSLYSSGVSHLLNNISNYQFSSINLITSLNKGISLDGGNIEIKDSVDGGEFSIEALNFKKYFNLSDITVLIKNFDGYYSLSIDPSTETSNEKLTVYYAKQILEI